MFEFKIVVWIAYELKTLHLEIKKGNNFINILKSRIRNNTIAAWKSMCCVMHIITYPQGCISFQIIWFFWHQNEKKIPKFHSFCLQQLYLEIFTCNICNIRMSWVLPTSKKKSKVNIYFNQNTSYQFSVCHWNWTQEKWDELNLEMKFMIRLLSNGFHDISNENSPTTTNKISYDSKKIHV